MPTDPTGRKAFRLEVNVLAPGENFSLQYDTDALANVAAEQIIKQGYVVRDWTKDQETGIYREYIPITRILSLDVVEKES